jgi:hypothetical protein
MPCNWERGTACAYGAERPKGLFLTPPMQGHVLIFDYKFARLDLQTIDRILGGMNREFGGRTCYFATQPNISAACWAVAELGNVRRAYFCSDSVTHLRYGEPLVEEAKAKFRYVEEIETLANEDESPVEEADIYRLAAMISVDPSQFGKPPYVELSVGLLAY